MQDQLHTGWIFNMLPFADIIIGNSLKIIWDIEKALILIIALLTCASKD
jgi:hypothetical protein